MKIKKKKGVSILIRMKKLMSIILSHKDQIQTEITLVLRNLMTALNRNHKINQSL